MPLSGGVCPSCGTYAWPKRFACRADATPLVEAKLSGTGRLHAWTTIRVAPVGFTAPYVLGFVVLDEGPRVLCQVHDDRLWREAQVAVDLVEDPAGERALALVARLTEVPAEAARV